MRARTSVLSKHFNTPKKYDGHKNLITGEPHRHSREIVKRLWRKAQLRFKDNNNNEKVSTGT